MDQFGLAGLRVAPAGLHAAGLEVLEVAARGNLAVLLLAGQPDLQIIGLGRGETHVPGAQGHDPVRQLQTLQHLFRVARQLFQGFIRIRRAYHLYQFDLFKLMLADQATRVLAIGSSLAAKARRVAGIAARHMVRLDNHIAHDVRHRHFGGRDQVIILLPFQGEQIGLELRQLARAHQTGGIDEVGDVGFGIAMLARVQVEHELDQRAVQARQRSGHQRKPGAGDLAGRFEIEHPERFAEVGVVLGVEIKLSRLAPAADFDVAALVFAVRHAVVRQVGETESDLDDPRLDRGQLRLGRLQLVTEISHGGHQRRGVFTLGLGLTDGLGFTVALRLQLLRRRLNGLALFLQRSDA